jgi:hypothetical protein
MIIFGGFSNSFISVPANETAQASREHVETLLPLGYRVLEPLFEAIFRWNPAERISVNAISKHPFVRNAHPCYEFPLARLPEIDQIPS